MTRPPPYVGVSGITTPEQAQAILDMWPASAPPQSLMIGVVFQSRDILEVCFPYGSAAETARGRGEVVNVMVEEIADAILY